VSEEKSLFFAIVFFCGLVGTIFLWKTVFVRRAVYIVGLNGGVEFGDLLRMMRDMEQGKKKQKKNTNVDLTEVMSKLRKDDVGSIIVTKDTVEDVTVAEPHLTIERQ